METTTYGQPVMAIFTTLYLNDLPIGQNKLVQTGASFVRVTILCAFRSKPVAAKFGRSKLSKMVASGTLDAKRTISSANVRSKTLGIPSCKPIPEKKNVFDSGLFEFYLGFECYFSVMVLDNARIINIIILILIILFLIIPFLVIIIIVVIILIIITIIIIYIYIPKFSFVLKASEIHLYPDPLWSPICFQNRPLHNIYYNGPIGSSSISIRTIPERFQFHFHH